MTVGELLDLLSKLPKEAHALPILLPEGDTLGHPTCEVHRVSIPGLPKSDFVVIGRYLEDLLAPTELEQTWDSMSDR